MARDVRRPLALAALTLAAAACGDGTGTGVDPLTPAEVEGVYLVCTLTFTPTQPALPPANLLERIIDTTPPVGRPGPSVALSGDAAVFDLVYTRQGNNFLQQLRGEMEFGENSVFLRMFQGGPAVGIPAELLLPPHLDLVFSATPRRLTAGEEVSGYSVARADYARAAGISEDNLAPRINGHVTALFSAEGCG
ncbi:MAG TPA: hypothetical protein VFX98_11335 [Longimicrobiaceae bacterium]|nr:hypothetical protein [Longimicrobiaceae bacterium]